MNNPRRRDVLVGAAALTAAGWFPSPDAGAQDLSNDARRLEAAAKAYLDSLGERKELAQFAFDDPKRTDWHWFPSSMRPNREGLRLDAMRDGEKDAAMVLLEAATTAEGGEKARAIMSLQHELGRPPGAYHFAVYGEPGSARFAIGIEGHHLSINTALIAGRIAAGPIFLGAAPTHVTAGPRAGLRAMEKEEAAARSALQLLPPALRARAIVASETPGDTISRNAIEVSPFAEEGLRFAELPQQALDDLRAAIAEYLSVLPPATAQGELQRLSQTALDQMSFAWAGSENPGEKYYWRVQTSGFVIEHDNSRDNAQHIHSVWRSFADDFGRASV